MSNPFAIAPLAPVGGADVAPVSVAPAAPAPQTGGFARLLLDGLGEVDRKVAQADATVRAFALDDNIPVHQVTYALEEARLSMELMMQVRTRLLEGFQDIMRMQL